VDFDSDEMGIAGNLYRDLERISSGEGNFVLYSGDPRSRVNSYTIKNLDIEKTTETENPICFKNSGGKIKITLKKDFSESLVTVVK
jgi:hypothetical protein